MIELRWLIRPKIIKNNFLVREEEKILQYREACNQCTNGWTDWEDVPIVDEVEDDLS